VSVDRQRSKLAAVERQDLAVQQAIKQSFVAGYRAILWVALSLANRQFAECRRIDIKRKQQFVKRLAITPPSACCIVTMLVALASGHDRLMITTLMAVPTESTAGHDARPVWPFPQYAYARATLRA